MSDIVERLRKENSCPPYYGVPKIQADAADEIERLRAALRMLHDEMDEYQRINNLCAYNNHVMRQARAALGEKA